MRAGVRLGVDVGSVRVGVAAADPAGILATPVTTLERRADGRDLARIAALAADMDAVEIVVGLPTGLSGRAGASARAVSAYAEALAGLVAPRVVRLADERFSTTAAARNLTAAGRDTRSSRGIIDQAAAVIILQSALDEERATGAPPGRVVAPAGEAGGSGGENNAGAAGGETRAR
jgi:putative Holliday junction resolvase